MNFEWDKEKAKTNLQKHRLSFDEAMTVFYDQLSATFEDQDHSVDEQRFITVGHSTRGRLLVVSYAERGKVIRIISARHATAYERKRHES